ncbi:NTP transferase domain-containing protein [Methanobrevibacter sp. DSM 116169]|uniref:NTP transferase domain-containing protein n=1 Tax=Methanobrevibacter sp. DSM 116169 TaxID=3242727 RepID=UPI0038FCF2D6
MKKINCAVISAAGMGTRLGYNIPKTLVDITDDRKIIDYQLELVKDIEDVRLVVGYKSDKVSKYVSTKREDIKIIHNQGYETNSTCYSIHLATEKLNEPYIAIDGDLLINKNEFNNFVNAFDGNTLLGITPAKTEDGVYVNLNESEEVTSFQRNPHTKYEWANIACINKPVIINKDKPFVYPQFEEHLPLKYFLFENCFEVDTPGDLEVALKNLNKL